LRNRQNDGGKLRIKSSEKGCFGFMMNQFNADADKNRSVLWITESTREWLWITLFKHFKMKLENNLKFSVLTNQYGGF